MSRHRSLEVHVATDVKRAAEMHYGLVKAAQAVAACREGQASASATNGSGQAAAVTTATNPTTPSPAEDCAKEYQQLSEVYKDAYTHITQLLESAQILAEDDALLNVLICAQFIAISHSYLQWLSQEISR